MCIWNADYFINHISSSDVLKFGKKKNALLRKTDIIGKKKHTKFHTNQNP